MCAVLCHVYVQMNIVEPVKTQRTEEAFTVTGFTIWSIEIDRFKRHEQSVSHRVNAAK